MKLLLLRALLVGLAIVALPALADAPIDVDAPVATPPVPAPPPIDEELMRELPPPALGMGELIGPLAKTLLMLCVVLFIVYLTLHKGLGKLVERQNAGKRVKVVERVVLDQKRSLFLIELDGKQMLLAAGEGGVLHLGDVEVPSGGSAPASGPRMGARFADALKTRMTGAPPVTTGLARSDDAQRKAT